MLIELISFILVAIVLIVLGVVVIPLIKQCSLEVFIKAAIEYAEENIVGDKKGYDRREWVFSFLRTHFKWLDEGAMKILVQGIFDMMDKNGLVNTKKGDKDVQNIANRNRFD